MNHKRLFSLTICWISVIALGLCVTSFAEKTNTEAQQHFEKANELRKAANYDAAVTEYKNVIQLSPNSRIAQDAQYWIGQSYFEMRQYDISLSEFKKLINGYPDSPIVVSTKQMIEHVQQAKKNKSLFEAVKKADVEQAKLLIADGAYIDAKWGDISTKEEEEKAKTYEVSSTPLYYASDSNSMDLVRLLVEAGADVNAGTWPPLAQAVHRGNTGIVKFLIDHGANVNYPEDWGPSHEAVLSNIEMVKLLLAKGADINAGYMPALHAAIFKGSERTVEDIVEFLIQRGANVNAKDTWGYTPLFWALNNMFPSTDDNNFYIDILNLLIANGADVSTKYPGGNTALFPAARTGKMKAVRSLLEAGADINVKNDRGWNILHAMLDVRHLNYPGYRPSRDMLELLLSKGADVNLKDKDGRTPLHLAVELADEEIVRLLLDKGAQANAKDVKSGFTALHYAVRLGSKNVAELLIARGADINAKDNQGHTPLYFAANHDYQVAELLINKGADSTIRTEAGQTLLELAQERRQLESMVPDMIFDGEPNSSFGFTVICGDVDGDTYDDVLIGAYQYDKNRGRVYLFYGGPDMDKTADLIFEGQNERDWFGHSMVCGDIDNDGCQDIIIAAGGYGKGQGRAYLYWGSNRNSMDANPDKIFDGEAEKGSQFGDGHPAVYDIDNDGYDDIILGAIGSGDRTGRAYLYYGNTKESMDTSHDLVFTGKDPESFFGLTISCGDVDNDGYGDIVIGGYAKQGRAYLYYGDSQAKMDANADGIFEAESEGDDYFGQGIVCADQNRDGYDDVIIGVTGYKKWQGRAYLFYGSAKRRLDANPGMVFDGENEGDHFGGLQVCGDIDGDNLTDLVIGAGGPGRHSSSVCVYWGKELVGSAPRPARILTGEHPNDRFGFGLACGDVNNDGYDDLVVGADGYKAGTKQGRAYLYYGGPRKK